jgi:hypothetical protein
MVIPSNQTSPQVDCLATRREYTLKMMDQLVSQIIHFLQVIHMVSHWVQLWALLSPEGLQDTMASGCTRLLMVAQDILCQAG